MKQKNILFAFLCCTFFQGFSQNIGLFPSFKDNPKWFLTETKTAVHQHNRYISQGIAVCF